MVTAGRRRGASKLGCLVGLLVAVAVLYFGFNIGEVWLRYYRYEDTIRQEARFARQNTDDEIRRRLAARADSLGLPDDASRVRIVRSGNRITISADYEEIVELPGFVRTFRFRPNIASEL
ncbi:MAG: hypothetical protein ACT4OZ_17645 [Gemmatimonadota bacterium]